MRHSSLFIAIHLALFSGPLLAQDSDEREGRHDTELETLVVRALPYERTALETAEPVDILAGEQLDDRRGMTLGETLANQPGVQSSYYGPGSGRPIIRGLGGARVRILEDGLSTGDASAPSDDHAVALDPMLVEQVEILRGPATLLYGSGASGGVINVIDNRIPRVLPGAPIEGSFELRGDTVADERSGVFRLDGAAGNFAWHVDGTWRDTDDYRIPGAAEAHEEHDHEDHEEDEEYGEEGTLPNSFVENRSGTIGLSWIGSRGFIGASYRQFESDYGIPAPHVHGDEAHEDHEEDEHEGEGEEGFATIDLEQQRFDLKGELSDPLPGFTLARLRLGTNDYVHREIEMEGEEDGHDEGEHEHVPTTFDVETIQARLELQNRPVAGFLGAIGLQADREDFVAIGEEAYIAPNRTDSLALFALQEREFGELTLSLGGRIERFEIEADLPGQDDHDHDEHDEEHHDHEGEAPDVDFDRDRRQFTNWSVSAGAIWQANEHWQTRLNLSRSQRAPLASELFANGVHLATFSYEIGDPNLGRETTLNWDLGLHRHSETFDLDINLFHKQVDDFIYLADTGEEFDGFMIRQAVQEDATFYGLEAQAAWQFHDTAMGDFDLRLAYDLVRGELDGGEDLPRISPQRLTSGLDWHRGPWRAGLEWQRVFRQSRVADFESPTPGYHLVNARLGYAFNLGMMPMEVYLSGHNLGDEEARVHTSYLRDFAPLPGRNLRFGLRGQF
ncbi:TonB-dependent receptor [Wenzhouxiangella marina]|uniref:Membrane protein n=1 Tax=Wenzhouxiangella marina TaxID=1579979 RepID=A0A0K0Y034_9GAMM|nr:TonB-dependent receptor [Wenzhouxiangella marina]AKS43303.1 membrane protein [Wenzhouxiangella marina]MBB6087006.1 iron complex outermembrane receptor protein [Wenzhouxiangella marina]